MSCKLLDYSPILKDSCTVIAIKQAFHDVVWQYEVLVELILSVKRIWNIFEFFWMWFT